MVVSNNCFVVWNPLEFGDFKHSNFSSFVRQLNTYGFKKVDPDRWEFANEGFSRGQKHLLKTISRRKPPHVHNQLHAQQSQNPNSACVEVGKFGLEEEVERLKRDKNVLMQELVRLRQQQQGTDNQLQTMAHRLQDMEQRQHQMMSFLAKAVQSPGFFAHFVQQHSETKRVTEGNKKRRIMPENMSKNGSSGQIVKYQSYDNDTTKTLFRQLWDMGDPSQSVTFKDNLDSFHVIGVLSPDMTNKGTSSSPTSGELFQDSTSNAEKPATAEAFGCKSTEFGEKAGSASVNPTRQSQNLDALAGRIHEAVCHAQSDLAMDEFPPILICPQRTLLRLLMTSCCWGELPLKQMGISIGHRQYTN